MLYTKLILYICLYYVRISFEVKETLIRNLLMQFN